MPTTLPATADALDPVTWDEIEPYLRQLARRPLAAGDLATWLADKDCSK